MTRLTEEMVIARSKQSDLASIKKLNCWGSDLTDVSIIKRMRGVEMLALSVNKINSLQPFEDCTKLQELYLRKNEIKDISEIAYLQNLPHLKCLWLEDNPCCEKAGPNYRNIVLRALPNLKKLDNVDVTEEEISNALSGSAGSEAGSGQGDEAYDDAYENQQQYQQPQQRPAQYPQQAYNSQSPQSPQQQYQQQQGIQRSSTSPVKDEYYQSDRPTYPANYRHSQTDLTEWGDHYHHPNSQYGSTAVLNNRRSAGTEREAYDRYAYRNGSARENGDWEDAERKNKARRPESRYNDSVNNVSPAVLNHLSNCNYRRPVHRTSNLLSATLCLVKELDYPSLEVVEHAVRCRIDELTSP